MCLCTAVCCCLHWCSINMAEDDDVKQCRFLWILPVLTFCFVPGCFIITYAIAVNNNHVHALLPMISETGEGLPENFVFAIIVNLGSFFAALNYVARYFVLEHWIGVCEVKHRRVDLFHNLNKSSMFVGFMAAAGALIVANVEANKHHMLHNFGAVTVILMQLSYNWVHTLLTYMAPIIHLHTLKHVRLCLSALCTLALATGMCVMTMAYSVPPVSEELIEQIDNGTVVEAVRFMGYRYVSTEHEYWWALFYYHLTEWLIVFLGGLFLLTFAPEFYNVHVEVPSVEIKPRPVKSRKSTNGVSTSLLPNGFEQMDLHQITQTPPFRHKSADATV